MKQSFDLSSFLHNNVKPALGCTEVVVIGLASSAAWLAARNRLPSFLESDSGLTPPSHEDNFPTFEDLDKVTIELDRNVFKNALAVNLPMPDELIGSMQKGIEFAAALGLVCPIEKLAESDLLTLFLNLDQATAQQAKQLKKMIPFKAKVVDGWTGQAKLNVAVKLTFKNQNSQQNGLNQTQARLTDLHTHFSLIKRNDTILYQDQKSNLKEKIQASHLDKSKQTQSVADLTLAEMLDLIQTLPDAAKNLLKKNITLNTALADKGLEGKHGLKLGHSYQQLMAEGKISPDLINYAKLRAAAAADARMGGAMLPAMSTAGSGNQGITATMPIIALAEKVNKSEQKLFQALALSHLVTAYVAHFSGHLSALCGCAVKAGLGAAAGACYYLGGDARQIKLAINNVAANICGVICDGAKEGCALKLATASEVAIESALLAMKNVSAPLDNGILAQTAEKTMQNIGKISNAMIKADQVIVQETMLS